MKLVLGSHFSIGGRDVYEDRVRVDRFRTVDGRDLAVALVADGVGGQAKGERASQLAVDAIFSHLKEQRASDVPTLMKGAIRRANEAVVAAAKEGQVKGMSTTVTLAVVEDGKSLFVANVGDSCAYLVRNGKLTKLTKDHTFANIMVWRGELTPEQAASHQKSEVVLWALGLRENVQIDMGFYVGTDDFREANQRGMKGLPLRAEDAIFVCSDGLVKESRATGEPLVREEEMIQTLESSLGEKAAKTLVAFALGREPDDNVSVATIHADPPSGLPQTLASTVPEAEPRASRLPWLVALVLFLLAGAFAFLWWRQGRQLSAVAAAATEAAASPAETQATPTEAAPPTATIPPSATPAPATEEPLVLLSAAELRRVEVGEILRSGEQPMALAVQRRTNDLSGGGTLLLGQGTTAEVSAVEAEEWRAHLLLGGSAFLYSGLFDAGATLRLEPSGMVVRVESGCLGVDQVPEAGPTVVQLTCYSGSCSYTPAFASPSTALAVETSYEFDVGLLEIIEERPIDSQTSNDVLASFEQVGLQPPPEAGRCLAPYLPTPTPVSPTVEGTAETEAPTATSPSTATPEIAPTTES